MNVHGRISIAVDDRERAGGLVAALNRRMGAAAFRVERLDSGDIQIDEQFLIERKTVADLAASLLDGRSATQLERFASSVKPPLHALIMLEGEVSQVALSGFAMNEFYEALLRIQLDWGLPLIRSRDVNDTAAWIELLARRAASITPMTSLPFSAKQTMIASSVPRRSLQRQPLRGAEALQLAALKQIPGLGTNKAARLLRHFGSVSAIVSALPSELSALPGISPELAAAVQVHLRRG